MKRMKSSSRAVSRKEFEEVRDGLNKIISFLEQAQVASEPAHTPAEGGSPMSPGDLQKLQSAIKLYSNGKLEKVTDSLTLIAEANQIIRKIDLTPTQRAIAQAKVDRSMVYLNIRL